MGNMDCKQCRRWWSPYLDSELDAGTTFQVAEHLRLCAVCRRRFEAEARFEKELRTRLQLDTLPAESWSHLCHEVRAEPRSLRFPLGRALAVAASVAMLVTAAILFREYLPTEHDRTPTITGSTRLASLQSVSDILQDRAPTLVPFDDRPESEFQEHLTALSSRCLGAVVRINPHQSGGHVLELISVAEQKDQSGAPYLEIRLNCCGHPMLIAIARIGCETCIAELKGITDNCKKKSRKGCPKAPPIETESVERGGLMIAAATADHYLTGVLAAISVTPLNP